MKRLIKQKIKDFKNFRINSSLLNFEQKKINNNIFALPSK